MTGRLWYAQLDIYDCVRRMTCLMSLKPEGLFRERLYILDFFFANPPMLHNTKMKLVVRSLFRDLKIPRPDKSFVTYPSAKLLFHQMEHVQKDAINALLGKGLAEYVGDDKRTLALSSEGRSVFDDAIYDKISVSEWILAEFLVRQYGPAGDDGMKGLRDSSGLRRAS